MDLKSFVSDKKNLPIVIVLVCALAVLVLWGNTDKAEEQSPAETERIENIERRLERVLEKVRGAGKVSVFVALEDYGATDFAKDSRQVSRQEESESEQTTVMQGSGSDSAPVVAKISSPKVKGVIVVAQGAENELVKENLAAAVEASLAIMPHRIKVLEGNN